MQEFASVRRSARSEYWPARFRTSASAFSKKCDCMPVAPTEPISSLSTSRQTLVRAGFFVSMIARKDG